MQDQSDSIEKLSINIKDSYSKFQGHWLDSNRADFSEKISVKSNQIGYRSWFVKQFLEFHIVPSML